MNYQNAEMPRESVGVWIANLSLISIGHVSGVDSYEKTKAGDFIGILDYYKGTKLQRSQSSKSELPAICLLPSNFAPFGQK